MKTGQGYARQGWSTPIAVVDIILCLCSINFGPCVTDNNCSIDFGPCVTDNNCSIDFGPSLTNLLCKFVHY